jgi:TonB family protein
MRTYVASAVLAAAFVLAAVAAGHAPALSQDFSITNPNDLTVEGAVLGPDWIRKLQEYWDLHAWYPQQASDNDESGTVKVHLKIHADGQVWWVMVEQSSGSKSLDNAAYIVFFKQYLTRFPPGTAAAEADLHISLHYVLAHRHDQPVNASTLPALSKKPFTVTNGPVKDTVVDTMQQRTCTGTEVTNNLGDTPPDSVFGTHDRVTAIFYRQPDGTAWVNWWTTGGTRIVVPVTELGVSAQWFYKYDRRWRGNTHYAVWPQGDNPRHLSGRTVDPPGTIDLTCE